MELIEWMLHSWWLGMLLLTEISNEKYESNKPAGKAGFLYLLNYFG